MKTQLSRKYRIRREKQLPLEILPTSGLRIPQRTKGECSGCEEEKNRERRTLTSFYCKWQIIFIAGRWLITSNPFFSELYIYIWGIIMEDDKDWNVVILIK